MKFKVKFDMHRKLIIMVILAAFTTNMALPLSSFNATRYPEKIAAPNPIKKIIKALAKSNLFVLNSPTEASAAIREQEENYTQLQRLATSAELEDLIRNHKSAVVRVYAFKALAHQMPDIPEEIMSAVNKDEALVQYINGDKTENAPVKQLIQNFLN